MNRLLSFKIDSSIFPPARIDPGTDTTNVVGFGFLATDVVLILTSLATAIAIIFIIIAGIKFVTSSGDEKKLASAVGTLTYAIIGLVVVILAFVIIRVVQYFIGASVPVN